MSVLPATAALSLLAGVALWGWGWGTRRCLRLAPLPVALTIAAGLAAVLLVGGIVIAARMAHPPVFNLIILVGVGLALAGLREAWLARRFALPRASLIVGLLVVGLGGFIAWHLVPPAAFNLHDDLEKYFAHPARLLANGFFYPNPLSTLGADSLGGQAFLQAFILAHFPIAYINAVDFYFCLLLCVALAGTALPAGRVPGALVAALVVVAIPPQVVNTSAVFSGSALLMAAIFLSARPARPDTALPSAPLLGLLFAAVISLKVTLVVFVACYLGGLALAGLVLGQLRLKWIVATCLWTAGFLLPWLVIHLPLYLLPAQALPPDSTAFMWEPLLLFSSTPLTYGVAPLPYTAFVLVALAAAILLAARRRGRPLNLPALAFISTGLATALGYFLLMVLLAPRLAGQTSSLRYCCPALLAAFAALLRLAEQLGPHRAVRFAPPLALLTGAALIGIFVPSAIKRTRLIAGQHLNLAYFPLEGAAGNRARFIAYNQDVLWGGVRQSLAQMQLQVPAGEPLGAWVGAPFWFDFKRNPVFFTDPAGLGLRWSHLPDNVHYFILEYEGFAVRREQEFVNQLNYAGRKDRIFARRSLDFLADVRRRGRAGQAQIVADDGNYVLLRFLP